jgi:hypothetical protein
VFSAPECLGLRPYALHQAINREELQHFDKSTLHPSNFDEIRKNQLGKNRNLAKLTSLTRIYAHADCGCHQCFPVGGWWKKK